MKIGLILPQWTGSMEGHTPAAPDVVAFARAAEGIGLDSVWLTDHVYFEPYLDLLDHGYPAPDEQAGIRVGHWECWTLLAALAASTERVELGTIVTSTGFRNPALLANMADTVDSLSNGRLILGLGAGELKSEYTFHGFPWERRVGRLEEALQIMGPMLNDERVTLDGEFYQVSDAGLLPRGPRPDGLPIVVGMTAGGPRMRRLAVQYADGWACSLVFQDSHAWNYAWRLDTVNETATKYERDPQSLARYVGTGLLKPGHPNMVPGQIPISGSPEEVAGELAEFRKLGVDHLAIYLQPNTEAGLEWLSEVLDNVKELA